MLGPGVVELSHDMCLRIPPCVALAHGSVLISSVGSGVWPVRLAIIVLTVRTVVGIAIIVLARVLSQDVLQAVDDDDPQYDPHERWSHDDNRGSRGVESRIRTVSCMIVESIVGSIVRIPIVSSVRTVDQQVDEPRHHNGAEHDSRNRHGGNRCRGYLARGHRTSDNYLGS
jgi:hypothetical protein